MDMIVDVINSIDAFVWGPPMLVLLLGSHIFLTFRTGFIQRKLPTAIKLSVTKDPDAPGDISQFGALCTALSATIGTGNIVGVGTAIIAGGPGAVFWMWITGVFGIATKYSETFAAVKYRVKDHNGDMLGGAMYAWKRGFTDKNGNTPWWALLGAGAFALFAAIASFGIGSAVQSSAMTEVISTNLPGVPAWGIGLAIVIMVSVVIFGGVKVISNVCEKLVPFMAIAYIWGCVVILGMNWELVWPAFCLIVESAFTAKAAFGGALGSGLMLALQFGCARGLFSNESGLGSAPIVASAAATRNPARQALVSMTGTFWDTVIICLLTGLVLVSTMLGNADLQSEIMAGNITAGAALSSAAFASIPYIGTPILIFGMILFAYSTILGWCLTTATAASPTCSASAPSAPTRCSTWWWPSSAPSAWARWSGRSPTSPTLLWPSRTSSWCCCSPGSSRRRRSITSTRATSTSATRLPFRSWTASKF